MIKSVNPFDNTVVKNYKEMHHNEVDSIIRESSEAFSEWKRIPILQRSALMKNAGAVLKANIKEYSDLMTLEMGKPIKQSKAEIEKCAWVCEYFAENSEKFLNDELVKTDASKSYVSYQPLGVILA